jgi:tetratricopeptide (TPR) repeat protein
LKAVAQLRLADYESAEPELKALNAQLKSNPYVLVCLGHCVAAKATRMQDFSLAYGFMRRAEGQFAESAAYWNNVGYCKTNSEEWKRAIVWLRKAATLEPDAVIHRNLAWACWNAGGSDREAPDSDELLEQAATHIGLAVDYAPTSADYRLECVQIQAATLRVRKEALSATERQTIIDAIMSHCEVAISLGGSKEDLRRTLAPVPELSFDSRFVRLPNGSARSTRPSPAARLLDPLRGIDVTSLAF